MTVTYQLSDEQLSRFFEIDKEKCIEAVYKKYWRQLYVYTFSIVKNSHITEDILQDVFLNIWKAKSIKLRNGSIYAYLINTAKYTAIRHLKQKIKTVELNNTIVESQNISFIESSLTAAHDSDFVQENIVKNGIHAMPPKMKEIFLLKNFNQLSYKQIAAKLGIAENTVKKQLYNAMKIFRNIVNKNI